MPDPTLRQLLEYSRPIHEFSQAIQTSLRLIQAAVAAEGQVENLKARAEAALKDVSALEGQKARLADDVQATRDALLAPVQQELRRLEGEASAARAAMGKERTAFDEERGRRTAILRALDEQVAEARKRLNEHQVSVKAKIADADRHGTEVIAGIQARIEETTRALDRLQADYRAVQQAAAKLAAR